MIVVDASVLASALADDARDGHLARVRLAAESLTAPEIVDVEVASVWRRDVAIGRLTADARLGGAPGIRCAVEVVGTAR